MEFTLLDVLKLSDKLIDAELKYAEDEETLYLKRMIKLKITEALFWLMYQYDGSEITQLNEGQDAKILEFPKKK